LQKDAGANLLVCEVQLNSGLGSSISTTLRFWDIKEIKSEDSEITL